MKGNVKLDPEEVVMVFERTPHYAEVVEKVRIELEWMDPSDEIELEGRHNVSCCMHNRLEDNEAQLRAKLECIQRGGVRITRQGS
jgi:hypothetical protein